MYILQHVLSLFALTAEPGMSALLAPKTVVSKPLRDQPIRQTAPPRPRSQRDEIDDLDDSHICGYYENSNGESSLTCPSNLYCTHDTQRLLLGCCDDADGLGCDYTTICYDYTATETITSTSIFRTRDGSRDTMKFFGMKCTDPDLPYCAQNQWTDASVKQYYCESYRNQVWFLGVQADSDTSSAATDNTQTPTVSPSFIASVKATALPTAEATGAATTALTSSEPSSTSTPDTEDSNNTGAIAGGIIGGVASVGILVLAILWLRKRRNADEKSIHPTAPSFNVIGSSILRNEEAASNRNATMNSTLAPASASMTPNHPAAQQLSALPPANTTFSSRPDLVEAPSDFAPSKTESHSFASISPNLPPSSLRPGSRIRRASSDSNLHPIDFRDSEVFQTTYPPGHEHRATPIPGRYVNDISFSHGTGDYDLGTGMGDGGTEAVSRESVESRRIGSEIPNFDGQAVISDYYLHPETKNAVNNGRGRGFVGSRSGPVSNWYEEDRSAVGAAREIP